MELGDFLERDIIHFLDEKKDRRQVTVFDREEDYGIYLTKDYLKELINSLQKDELGNAQRLFEELRSKYSTVPKDTLESKKIYSMLEQMYAKIDTYIKLRGDSRSTLSFSDILNQGYNAPTSSRGNSNVGNAKIEKKIDKIDQKITNFGQDVHDLKNSIMDGRSSTVHFDSVSQPIILQSPEIKISPIIRQNNIEDKRELVMDSAKDSSNRMALWTPGKIMNAPDLKTPEFKIPDKGQEVTPLEIKSSEIRFPEINPEKKSFDLKSFDNVGFEQITENKAVAENKGVNLDVHSERRIFHEAHEHNAHERHTGSGIKLFKIPKKYDDYQTSEKRYLTKTTDYLSGFSDVKKPVKKKVSKKNTPKISSILDEKNSSLNNSSLKKSGDDEFNINKKELKKDFSKDIQNMYETATTCMNKKDYENASKLFSKVLAINPAHTQSKIRLKQCREAMHHA